MVTKNWVAQQIVHFPCAIHVDSSIPEGDDNFFWMCHFFQFFSLLFSLDTMDYLCGFRTEYGYMQFPFFPLQKRYDVTFMIIIALGSS